MKNKKNSLKNSVIYTIIVKIWTLKDNKKKKNLLYNAQLFLLLSTNILNECKKKLASNFRAFLKSQQENVST